MKRYELTNEVKEIAGIKLHRIKALKNFGDVEAGELGGWIEKESNLNHNSDAWVYDDAMIYGNAMIYDNAKIYGNARVCGNAQVYGNAMVYDNAVIYDNTRVYGNTRICGNAWVYGNTKIYDSAMVYDNTKIYGNAEVCGNARVCGNAKLFEDAWVCKREDVVTIGSIGSRNDTVTFFKSKVGKIKVATGCFRGDILEFEKAVEKTHKGSKHEKTYKLAIEMAKMQIEL